MLTDAEDLHHAKANLAQDNVGLINEIFAQIPDDGKISQREKELLLEELQQLDKLNDDPEVHANI